MIKEHTEKINPSRALWVPFELGRPLGVPNDTEFQLDVLRSLLALFEIDQGPVIVDYPRDAPESSGVEDGWSCVIPLPALEQNLTPAEALKQSLELEVGSLMVWYNEALRSTGRTTFGLSGLTAEAMPEIAGYLGNLASGENTEPPETLLEKMTGGLRYIIDDVKSFYMEAASGQPAASDPSGDRMYEWFFYETRMGKTLFDIRDRFRTDYEESIAGNNGNPESVPQPLNPIPMRFSQRRDQ